MTGTETQLDLGGPDARALLRRLDLRWQGMDAATRATTLAELDIVVSPPESGPLGVLLLPGGSVALGAGPLGPLVCDPAEALAFDAARARRLFASLARRQVGVTLLHTPDGIQARGAMPTALPLQAVTLVPAGTMRRLAGWNGPAAVQWHAGGAVAWPLAPAPRLLALAAALAAIPILAGEPSPPANAWAATTADAVFTLVSPAIAEHVDDLLALEVSDALRWALVAACADGLASLASRMAEALLGLPSFLLPDPATRPGAPEGARWEAVLPLLADARTPQALLGLEMVAHPRHAVLALRVVLAGIEARLHAGDRLVGIGTDAAMFAARHAAATGGLAIVLPPPADGPAALYALAREIAERTGVVVLAAAPCWGFRHRVAPDGQGEAGNAAWFGMGPSLAELEFLCDDPS